MSDHRSGVPYAPATTSTATSRSRTPTGWTSSTTTSGCWLSTTPGRSGTRTWVVPVRHIASLTSVTAADEADVRALLAVVQAGARRVETDHGEATVLTNLGRYQDSISTCTYTPAD